MRIFRVGSNKHRKLRRQHSLLASKQQQHPLPIDSIPSIGSELAASDQFEIVVARRENDGPGEQQPQRKKTRSGGFFSYFSSDNDDSTVSSITTVEYGGFFRTNHSSSKRQYSIHHATSAAAASISSWCCCGDSDHTTANTTMNGGATRRTHPSSTDNTLIQHSAYGTLQPNDSRSQMYRSMSGGGSRCCGPDGSVSPIKRQRSFLFSNYYWGRNNNNNQNHRNHNNNHRFLNTNSSMKNTPNMSASLFDDLSEDELDIHVKRSTSFSVGRRAGKKYYVPPTSTDTKPVSLRRVMTWKRKVF